MKKKIDTGHAGKFLENVKCMKRVRKKGTSWLCKRRILHKKNGGVVELRRKSSSS